jgi:hypothetical protein
MAFVALDLVLWQLGVRGHIPRFDDFRPAPAAPAAGFGNFMRALAAMAAVVGALSLAIWAAVWLALQML